MIVSKINAVHADDVGKYLESLGLLEGIKNGKYVCSICKKDITLNNILCFYPYNDQVKFCCDDSICYEAILKIKNKNDNA